MSETSEDQPRRTAREIGKSNNRSQLIEAAANAIHRHGIRGTTAATIQELSGLSRGMVNLHFGSKENLLQAVAETLAGRYAQNWRRVAEAPGLTPAERLRGVIIADFDPLVLNVRDVSIWFSFRAEAASNPELRRYIDSRDRDLRSAIIEICTALKEVGGYEEIEPQRTASALIALLEGMWTDFHLNARDFDRSEAIETCFYVARSFFPDHF